MLLIHIALMSADLWLEYGSTPLNRPVSAHTRGPEERTEPGRDLFI